MMKTKTFRFKRLLSLLMALVMTLSALPVMAFAAEMAEPTTVYFKPNANWREYNARFAVYYFSGSASGWVDMEDSDADGVYAGVIPAGYSQIIFCRMDPGTTENNWGNKWSQTADLTLPTDGSNCYGLEEGDWDGKGAWTAYTPETKPTEPAVTEPKETEPEETKPSKPEYYLVGYINEADYDGDDYKFVDGKLTATFTKATYVNVKSSTNTNWYVTDGYQNGTDGTTTSVTLYDASTITTDDKFQLPTNEELTLTLTENTDGTLTLSFETKKDPEPDIPEGKVKVNLHFFKSEGWGGTINAYLWSGSSAVSGYEDYHTWPGKAIGANASHDGWYDLTVGVEPGSSFNFIFNDGGNQTSDLTTGVVDADTELWVVGNEVMKTAPAAWNGIYTYKVILNFHNTSNWPTVNVKFGQGDSWDAVSGFEQYKNNEFGAAMEANTANDGWYSLTFDVVGNDAAINGLFNNGSWGTGNQTGNWTTGKLNKGTNEFWYDGDTLSTTAPENFVDLNRKIYVPGSFPGPSWDAASNQMHFDAELGLYVYTFKNVPAANYEFKIAVNGSWTENYGAGGVPQGSNIAVTVPETADVTIYYNDKTHNAVTSVSYVFADIVLSGSGIPDGTKLSDKGLTGIYTVTVSLAAATYTDLKLVDQDNNNEYKFPEFTLDEPKSVTFYFDPITGLYYSDATNDTLDESKIYYDSQDEAYKAPFGAVATGEDVTFGIDTGAEATSAVLVIKGAGSYPMTLAEQATRAAGKKHWSVTVKLDKAGEYDYYFAISGGSGVAVYGDDDGYYGTGKVSDLLSVMPYDLVVYNAGFETPDWMKNAVIYQIFPDRFFDGDVTNNQAQTWARGDVDYEYITDWYTLPENPEQEAMLSKDVYLSSGAHYGDGEWSNEIYGGDLKGITERIDYLKALGVNVIYLNPVFWSISNHRYDAVDYTEIDPILGTLGDFEELVRIAEANDMHIILDGVFNHVSDDSVYFDRYGKFLPDAAEKYDGKIGAYPYWSYVYDLMATDSTLSEKDAEAKAKVYFTETYGITDYSYTAWFEISSTKVDGVYSYQGWWGYDSMPVIKSTNGSEYQTGNWSEEVIDGTNSVAKYWIRKGSDGWRLDVANEVSDETWQHFRNSVKSLNSDAVIIGEIWDDATHYLMGDMYDSVMNYMFRNAVTSYAMGTDAEQTTKALEKIRERYPEEAFYAMMNLVGSHDTTRILSYLDGIDDDRNQKDFDSAFPTYEKTSDAAKARQYLVAFLQFTYPGAPTIYYGDEIGMVGSDDPDDRRAFEWGKGNQELVEWYATLAAIREAYPALRTGDIEPMDLGNSALLAYRRTEKTTSRAAAQQLIVIANNAASAQTVTLEGSYVDVISGKTMDGTVTIPARNGVILVQKDQVQKIQVDKANLAPAYSASYIVKETGRDHTKHSYTAVVTEPTCTEQGYTTYTCTCGKSYVDDYVAANGHTGGKATCSHKAMCDSCHTEYGEVDPKNHDGGTEIRDAVEATEQKQGYTGDTYCKGCGKKIAEGKVIEKLSHVHALVKTPARAATEYVEGNIEYYTCSKCGKIYKDADGTEEITKDDTVIAKLEHTHKLKKTAAKKATKYTTGNIEYYTCTECGKIYKDAKATKEIALKDTVIPKLTDNSATGDSSHVLLWSGLMILSAAALVFVVFLLAKNRKREDQ